jgi:hypothetical protein
VKGDIPIVLTINYESACNDNKQEKKGVVEGEELTDLDKQSSPFKR